MTRIVSLAERPDLEDAMWNMPNTWPAFMLQDPVAEQFFGLLPRDFAAYQLVALDDADQLIGKLNMIPFHWAGTHDDLPARGWDAVLERGFADRAAGREPAAVSLLEARVVAAHLGTGLATELLLAGMRVVADQGLHDLFGPVRPTRKSLEPATPMADLRRPGQGRRATGRFLAARPCPARRGDRRDLPGVDDRPRHARAMAELDRAADGHLRVARGARCAGSGARVGRARPRRLRRAQRLGAPPGVTAGS